MLSLLGPVGFVTAVATVDPGNAIVNTLLQNVLAFVAHANSTYNSVFPASATIFNGFTIRASRNTCIAIAVSTILGQLIAITNIA